MHMQNEFMLRKFVSPEFVFGENCRFLIGEYAKKLGGRIVLIVTDEGLVKAGWVEEVKAYLANKGIKFVIFSGVTPNPRVEEIGKGAVVYKNESCNMLVAVGGGSVIDCAKGIGVTIANAKPVMDFVGVDKIRYPIPPLICLPSTPGTGADLSQVAVLSNTQEHSKVGIVSKAVVPDLSLIDPVIVTTIPQYHLYCSLMDILTHAIEAFVSKGSSAITDLHALDAIKRITNIFDLGLISSQDKSVVNDISIAGIEAGLAFSNASLGLVHSLSHSFEGLTDISHGESISIFLEASINFNYDTVPHKYKAIGKCMGLSLDRMDPNEIKEAIIEKIGLFKKTLGFNKKICDYGINRDCIPFLVQNAMKDNCIITNPHRPNRRDIEAIYEKLF
ncbi:UNVERIFIED_CONTAM: alcohol dehydrogenase class IV [Acetivibrio alkalicellulosi]